LGRPRHHSGESEAHVDEKALARLIATIDSVEDVLMRDVEGTAWVFDTDGTSYPSTAGGYAVDFDVVTPEGTHVNVLR